jgi:hypothetical protein
MGRLGRVRFGPDRLDDQRRVLAGHDSDDPERLAPAKRIVSPTRMCGRRTCATP